MTITLPIDLPALVAQAIEQAVREAVAAAPPLDPLYTVAQVAEAFQLAPETIRSYLALPYHHPRRLPYVRTSGSTRGNRIRQSDLVAWQERNLNRLPEELSLTLTRPARRRK